MIKASIIIPAYNASKTIEALLDSLLKQNYPRRDYEIIVVDDGSTDKTASLLKKYSLLYLFQKHKGAGAARNFGAQSAKGEVVLFLDSDCVVPKDWIKKTLERHEKNKITGMIGGGVKKPKRGTYLAWADFFSSWFNAHEDLPRQEVKEYLPSLNLSLKREVFQKLGGFWERKITGEDVDFCFRARTMGIKILFNPSLAVWHQSSSLKGFLKHHFNWGYHAPFVRGKQKSLAHHRLFSGGFLKSLFLFWPIVLGYTLFLIKSWWRYQPLRVIVCLPLIFLGKVAYGIGFLKGSWQKTYVSQSFK